MITEGQAAPAFSLPGSDGQTHQLSEYAGKTVVLYFYPKDDTPGCTKEACAFRDLKADFDADEAVILGVSPDASHGAFIDKFDLPFVLLSDPDHEVMETYGAWGEKLRYGKTVIGVIRSTTVIAPDGTVAKHWKKVPDAAKHPEKVLEIVQSLKK